MSVDENEKDHHSRSLKRGLSKRAKKVRRFFKVGYPYSCGVCSHTHHIPLLQLAAPLVLLSSLATSQSKYTNNDMESNQPI